MTKSSDRPPFENCLYDMWVASEFSQHPLLDPPVPFDARQYIGPLLGVRRRLHFDPSQYLSAMGKVAAVTASSALRQSAHDPERRSIALLGFTTDPTRPRLTFDLTAVEERHIVECRVTISPAVSAGSETPQAEHEIALVPLSIFAADRAGLLTAQFAADSGMPKVQALAHAAGRIVWQAARL